MMRERNLSKKIVQTLLCVSYSIFPPLWLAGQQPATLPDWKVNEASLNQLETASSVDEFSIRPPKGYSLQKRTGPHGSKMAAWAGPPRVDGTRPQVMVMTAMLPPDELKKYNLDQALDELVSSLSYGRKEWTRTATEKGLVNGLIFGRTRWSGLDLHTGWKMHGFVYVAIVGKTVIQLSSQDLEPHHEESLKLAELSLLTFKSRSRAVSNIASSQSNKNGI